MKDEYIDAARYASTVMKDDKLAHKMADGAHSLAQAMNTYSNTQQKDSIKVQPLTSEILFGMTKEEKNWAITDVI